MVVYLFVGMAAPRAALLSSDELKAYLLHSLQGRGVLDSLKVASCRYDRVVLMVFLCAVTA